MSLCTHIDQVGHLVERLHQPEGVQLVVDVVGALRVGGGAGRRAASAAVAPDGTGASSPPERANGEWRRESPVGKTPPFSRRLRGDAGYMEISLGKVSLPRLKSRVVHSNGAGWHNGM